MPYVQLSLRAGGEHNRWHSKSRRWQGLGMHQAWTFEEVCFQAAVKVWWNACMDHKGLATPLVRMTST